MTTTPLRDGFLTTFNIGAVATQVTTAGLINGTTAIAFVKNNGVLDGTTIELAMVDGQGLIIDLNGLTPGATIPVTTLASPGPVADLNPQITALSDGRFVVTWNSTLPAANDVFARFYSANGVPQGEAFVVNVPTGSSEGFADVTADGIGGFFVSWNEGGTSLVMQQVDATGNTPRDELIINPGSVTSVSDSAIASIRDGGGGENDANFIVWTELIGPTPGIAEIRGQKVQGNLPQGPVTVISTSGGAAETDAAVATLADNRLIVTFTQGGTIFGRFIDRFGAVDGAIFQVSTLTGNQIHSKIAALDDGRFVVAWKDIATDEIRLRTFDRDGRGGAIEVIVSTANVVDDLDVTTLADGRVSVVWHEDNNVGGILTRAQIFDARASAITKVGNGFGEHFVGTTFGDAMSGRAGNDFIDGRAGDDTLNGDDGNDTVLGDLGNDVINGGNGNDSLAGGAGVDELTGGAGNDSLNGQGGPDVARGGLGNDTYQISDAGDLVVEAAGQGIDTVESNEVSIDLGKFANVENARVDGFASRAHFVKGNALNNVLTGDSGNNLLQGLGGNDTLLGADGSDNMQGGDGNDTFDGGDGADTLNGGAGNDTYVFGAGDTIIEAAGRGTDTVRTAQSLSLGANVERGLALGATAINLTGNGLNNVLTGNNVVNILVGSTGNDALRGLGGNDIVRGGVGNDSLRGDLGRDVLRGESGSDLFVYGALSDSTVAGAGRDLIEGFTHGQDRFDLSLIDARTSTPGNQVFSFVGSGAFTGVGQVRAFQSGGHTFVDVNMGGSSAPEMRIEIDRLVSLTAIDFVL